MSPFDANVPHALKDTRLVVVETHVRAASVQKRFVLMLLLAILFMSSLLRAHTGSMRAIWFDESFFWRLSRFPTSEVVARTAADNYPALYPLLLKMWCAVFGSTEEALRSLSVLCGVATVWGVYLFCVEALRHADDDARTTRNSGTALLAAALVALSVFQIRWSWDVKMMTLGAMLSVFSSWALFRALRLRSRHAWLVYAALALAFLHTHYYALFSVFAQWAFAAIIFAREAGWSARRALRDASCRRWSLAMVVVAAGCAPWAPAFVWQHQRERAEAMRRPVTSQRVMKTPYSLFVEPEPEDADTTDDTALVVFLICEFLLLASLARPTRAAWYVFLAATVPLALGVLVSLLDTRIFEVRYLAFAQPFWLIAAAMSASLVPWTAARWTLGAALIGCSVFTHARFLERTEFDERPGARGAAEYIEARRRPGEAVLVCGQVYYYPLMYYTHCAPDLWLFDDGKNVRRHYWGSAVILPGDLLSRDRLEALACPRVWTVDCERASWGPLRVPRSSRWKERSQKTFRGAWGFEGNYVVTEYENQP